MLSPEHAQSLVQVGILPCFLCPVPRKVLLALPVLSSLETVLAYVTDQRSTNLCPPQGAFTLESAGIPAPVTEFGLRSWVCRLTE